VRRWTTSFTSASACSTAIFGSSTKLAWAAKFSSRKALLDPQLGPESLRRLTESSLCDQIELCRGFHPGVPRHRIRRALRERAGHERCLLRRAQAPGRRHPLLRELTPQASDCRGWA
jgi:hypothetical protein